MTATMADMTAEFLDIIFASVPASNEKRYLTGAVGHGGHYNGSGKYEFDKFEQYHYEWPAQRGEAVAWIQRWAPTCDVYTCPYLQKTPERKKWNAAWRQIVHSDADGNADELKKRVAALGAGFIVWSGTSGHGHVYVLLSHVVTRAQHEVLCEGLRDYLGGDAKIRDNDLLRPPGSYNLKLFAYGGRPTPIMPEFGGYNATPIDPFELAKILDIDINTAAPASNGHHPPVDTSARQRVDLDLCPSVCDEMLKTEDEDRSKDTYRIICKCVDSGLNLEQTRWVIDQRPDLAERVNEFLMRRPPVDDVAESWDKASNEWQRQITWMDPSPKPKPVSTDEILDIENGFWDARESLKTVYDTALSRMCAPWAVLACCAAKALTIVPPCITLPPLIGGPGSLNWFAAIVAPSGGGKGSAMAVARDLIGESVYQRNLGSGEGMVTAYQTRADDECPDGVREAVMFVADEIDNMTALGGRSGSTLMGTLRSAFNGETIGFSYATRGRDIHLQAHTYRMTFLCSIQPGRAASLLGDGAGGTPQRFMWFPGMDRRIVRRKNQFTWTASLTLPNLSEWLYRREITIPADAENLILDQRVDAMHGKAEPLDAHAIFAREKFAFALTVLDGRVQMSQEDWELSGIAAQVSTHTREYTLDVVREASKLEARERGALRGVEMEAADVEKNYQEAERTRRMLRWMLDRLEKVGETGETQGDLNRKAASRDRIALAVAMGMAVRDGLAGQNEEGKWVKL